MAAAAAAASVCASPLMVNSLIICDRKNGWTANGLFASGGQESRFTGGQTGPRLAGSPLRCTKIPSIMDEVTIALPFPARFDPA